MSNFIMTVAIVVVLTIGWSRRQDLSRLAEWSTSLMGQGGPVTRSAGPVIERKVVAAAVKELDGWEQAAEEDGTPQATVFAALVRQGESDYVALCREPISRAVNRVANEHKIARFERRRRRAAADPRAREGARTEPANVRLIGVYASTTGRYEAIAAPTSAALEARLRELGVTTSEHPSGQGVRPGASGDADTPLPTASPEPGLTRAGVSGCVAPPPDATRASMAATAVQLLVDGASIGEPVWLRPGQVVDIGRALDAQVPVPEGQVQVSRHHLTVRRAGTFARVEVLGNGGAWWTDASGEPGGLLGVGEIMQVVAGDKLMLDPEGAVQLAFLSGSSR